MFGTLTPPWDKSDGSTLAWDEGDFRLNKLGFWIRPCWCLML